VAEGRELGGAFKRLAKIMASYIKQHAAVEGRRRLDAQLLDEAFDSASTRLAADAGQALRQSWQAARDTLLILDPTFSKQTFHEALAAKRQPALLLWALDQRSCQSCGVCAAVCPEDAIELRGMTESLGQALHEQWDVAQSYSDTSCMPLTLNEEGTLGPLSAILLDPDAAQAWAPSAAGSGLESGSGVQLAMRWLCAIAHFESTRRVEHKRKELQALLVEVSSQLRQQLSDALPLDDPRALERALSSVRARRDNLEPLLSELREGGKHSNFDRELVESLSRVARELKGCVTKLDQPGALSNPMLVAHEALVSLSKRNVPFTVTTLLSRGTSALQLARALAKTLVDHAAQEAEVVRRARILSAAPGDWKQQLQHQGGPARDLSPERLVCVVDASALRGAGLDALLLTLRSEQPTCVVVFDDSDQARATLPISRWPICHPDLMCAASSLADPLQFTRALQRALSWPAPALLVAHCPSPSRHRFAQDELIAQAAAAVQSCAKPLFIYTPARDGEPAQLDLDTNAPSAPLAATQAEELGHLRRWFDGVVPTGSTQGVAGGPEPQQGPNGRTLEALRKQVEQEQVDRLTERLLELAGDGSRDEPTNEEAS
jgi:pyruvate-ferredoxin/flavodoxin oxidoreductase